MYHKLNPELVIMIAVIATILTLIIASIPAYKAMKTKPNAALRD
jgi:ABC-type lipoprotein release transport system permease subunit